MSLAKSCALFRCAGLALALSGCTAPAARNAASDGRFDGAYVGSRTQDAACGTERHSITFHVEAGRIEVRSRHTHRALAGTVGMDGQIALSDPYGGRQVTGRIDGNRLEATEMAGAPVDSKHRQITTDDPNSMSCAWHYVALRVVTPDSPANRALAE